LNLDIAYDYIKKSNKIVILSGAGLSTNAGIPDFRSDKGLYNDKNIKNAELIFDLDYFYRDQTLFYGFYKNFLNRILNVKPTVTHEFFSYLEERGKILAVITQNIDSLHQKAGSKKVYQLHGGTDKSFCTKCRKEFDNDYIIDFMNKDKIPVCSECGSVVKPDIVFFGENVKYMNESFNLVSDADLLIIVGSSLTVMPAAALPEYSDCPLIIVNRGPISKYYIPEENVVVYENGDTDEFFSKIFDKFR